MRSPTRLEIAAIWGLLMGGLTFAAGPLSWISANKIVGAVQVVLVYLLAPGLLVAGMTGSFVPGAVANGLFHFGLCRLVVQFLVRPRNRADICETR
jgi:hypothetical protein